jgi:Cu/Ag efflux protein CusF
MVKLTRLVVFLCLALAACSRKPEASGPERHYPLSGRVIALDSKHQTATIDAAAIPNFMEAMTMEYPVKSKADFNALHVGDKITATVNVSASGDTYDLSGIQKQNTQTTPK